MASAAVGLPVTSPTRTHVRPINLLAYVHLRNIHNSTGAGRVARQLTEHLSRRDDLKLRILADAADKQRILPLVGEPWTSFDYSTFARDTSRQQALWFALGQPKAEEFWPDADIVFCTGESYVPTSKARLAVTLHDAAYFEQGAHAPGSSFQAQRWKWKLLFGLLARKADLFHTVSQFSAERLAHFFPQITKRLVVVPNAVSPHFFLPIQVSGAAYLRDVGLADRQFVLIPGGLHFRKNAELILTALPRLCAQFPETIFAVVNHSNAAYAQKAAAIAPNVRLLGFVTDEALRALYGTATVVWFPSLYEGFGLPVIEAMACGAPVIASDASSIPEVAGGAALLVPPTSPEAHVAAIAALLMDDAARGELRRAGKARADAFTWARSAETLKEAFDRLM